MCMFTCVRAHMCLFVHIYVRINLTISTKHYQWPDFEMQRYKTMQYYIQWEKCEWILFHYFIAIKKRRSYWFKHCNKDGFYSSICEIHFPRNIYFFLKATHHHELHCYRNNNARYKKALFSTIGTNITQNINDLVLHVVTLTAGQHYTSLFLDMF